MSETDNCAFCLDPEKLKSEIVFPDFHNGLSCNRCFYDEGHCFAILAPEQYTYGHSLVVTRKVQYKHIANITDDIPEGFLPKFTNEIHEVSKILKNKIENEQGEQPKNIYICILCDGIKHLHAHLIPRYRFTPNDENIYSETFSQRDGIKSVLSNIESDEIGGYWYIAEREKNFKNSVYWQQSPKLRAEYLEKLASKLRG